MGNIFAGSEIVELGIQIEKNGRDFYDTLAKKSRNKEAAEIFRYLSGEEKKHIEVFQGILNRAEKYEPAGLDADDYFEYMNILAGENIFTSRGKGEQVARRMKGSREAVNMGIGFEKDSIIFYEGMKKAVPEYDAKIVDELILQERGHLKILSDLKKNL